MSKKDDKRIKASVVIDISVDEAEWMERYGEAITRLQLVPSVTLINALKKAARTKLAELELKTLEVK